MFEYFLFKRFLFIFNQVIRPSVVKVVARVYNYTNKWSNGHRHNQNKVVKLVHRLILSSNCPILGHDQLLSQAIHLVMFSNVAQ